MDVEVVYGEPCPQNIPSITPAGPCPPPTLAPEWLLSKALAHDISHLRPERLATLLRLAPGPHNILKAAAVEPEEWWGILGIAAYTGSPSQCQHFQLLPFAPAVSTLAALPHKEMCIYAESLQGSYLFTLIHALGSYGAQRLILIDPPHPVAWHRIRVKGVLGYSHARRLSLPRVLQLRALAQSMLDVDKAEAKAERPKEFNQLSHTPPQDLLKLAFGDEAETALSLLTEIDAGGGIMSYRALLDAAATFTPDARGLARKLILFGYLRLRQAQVEITPKGLFTLL
ncbi:MAG: hypothetical protein ABWK01_05490 [Infirmifilum sp.]